jgi:hypothetical protein
VLRGEGYDGWRLDLKDDDEADGEARYLDLHTYVGKATDS